MLNKNSELKKNIKCTLETHLILSFHRKKIRTKDVNLKPQF